MTEYLLAVHHSARTPQLSAQESQESMADTQALNARLHDAGVYVFAGGLTAVEAATVVRQSGSDIMITDGPFPETKEYLAGFWIISVADLDEALDWARQATTACRAPVEVRPFGAAPPVVGGQR